MADLRTAAVWSGDGGGMRTYLAARFQKLFVGALGIPQNEVWKHFPVMCGSSGGGMVSLALAAGMTIDDILPFFTNDGPWIFTIRTAADVAAGRIDASDPSNRPSTIQKIGILFNNDQFYTAVDPASNYGSSRLQSALIETFGDMRMNQLKTKVIITAYDYDNKKFQLYSNADYAEFVGQDALVRDVARYTSAAPLYLPKYNNKGDGGMYNNNPSAHGRSLALAEKLTANRTCMFSAGTGIGEMGFDSVAAPMLSKFAKIVDSQTLTETFEQIDEELNAVNIAAEETAIEDTKNLAVKAKALLDAGTPFEDAVISLVTLFDTAMTGGQESTAAALDFEAKYTRNRLFNYRFQPPLDLELDTELDNSSPEILTYYENLAQETFNAQSTEINEFIARLQL